MVPPAALSWAGGGVWESVGLQEAPHRPGAQGDPGLCREDTGDSLVLLSPGLLSSEKLEKEAVLKKVWVRASSFH